MVGFVAVGALDRFVNRAGPPLVPLEVVVPAGVTGCRERGVQLFFGVLYFALGGFDPEPVAAFLGQAVVSGVQRLFGLGHEVCGFGFPLLPVRGHVSGQGCSGGDNRFL